MENKGAEMETKTELKLLALIITVFGGLLTVVYSDKKYDIWDLGIGTLVISVCIVFWREFAPWKGTRWLSRVGFSTGAMIILMTIITLVSPDMAELLSKTFFRILNGEALITAAIFALTLLFLKPHKQ